MVDYKPALVLIMVWRRIGDKPLYEPTMAYFLVFWRIDMYTYGLGKLSNLSNNFWAL